MHPSEHLPSPPAQLHEQLAILRLRRWWIIGIMLATVGAALGLSLLQDEIYVAESRVLVRPVPIGAAGEVERPNMETERQLAASAPVAALVAQRLGTPTVAPSDLLGGLDVDVVEDTEILIFRYADGTAGDARDAVQAFADSYLLFRQQETEAESDAAADAIREELTLQQEQLRSVNRRLGQTNDPVLRRSLEAQQLALATEIGTLRNRLVGIEANDTGRVGQVTQPAEEPSEPSSPKPLRNAALALFAGLALGIGAAFLVDRLDDRLRGPESVELITGATTMSVVPQIPSDHMKAGPVMLGSDDPYSEAFRTLRTGLTFTANARGARTILVTSPTPGDGKTHTVTNLAIALAQSGKRVVALSADLRRPQLHRSLGIPSGPGLTELLLDRRGIWDLLVRPEGIENLWVLPSGGRSARPTDLLGSRQMSEVLQTLRDSADVVLVDVGPVLAVPDALALAPLMDAVLLVVAAERTTRTELRQTVRQLRLVHADVIGTVFNGFRPGSGREGYYYGQYAAEPDPSLRPDEATT